MHIKNGLIIVGLTVLLFGLLGLFGYGPVAAVTGTPLAGATVTLNALTTCTISSCTSLPTLTPATLSGTTTATGTVTFPAPTYTLGSGMGYQSCTSGASTLVPMTFSGVYFVSVNGVATGVSFPVGPTTYTCPNSAPTTILGLSTVTAYVGTSYVIIILGTATSTTTSTSSTSTSTTTSTTTTTAACTTNCPPPFPIIVPSVVTLLGAGITVVGIARKESG